MSCDYFDALKTKTESLLDRIIRRPSRDDLWLNVIPQGNYPVGAGVSQTTFTIGNSEPISDTEQWQTVTIDGTQINPGCENNYQQVDVGFDETTYGPRKFQLKGPVICKDSLTYHHEAARFLTAYEEELMKRSKRSWSFQMRNTYLAFAKKVKAGADLTPEDGPGWGTTLPTSQLTPDMLDEVAQYMIYENADISADSKGFVGLSDSGPLFPLYIGMKASARIVRLDPELRKDARDADTNQLFKRMGANRTLGNFRHVITPYPPRFDFVEGAFVQVPTFIMVDATQGKKAKINPDWVSAPYEAAIPVVPSVFTAEIVNHVNSAGKTIRYGGETKYLGQWDFVKGAHRLGIDCLDPKEKLGQHLADFEYAPRPDHPEHAFAIMFKRCFDDHLVADCADGEVEPEEPLE